MKKIITYLCTLVLLVTLFPGCGSSFRYDFDLENAATDILGLPEGSNVFQLDADEGKQFDVQQYKQEGVPQTRTFTLLDQEFVGEYETTALLPESDVEVHAYRLKDTEFGRIIVDTKTDKILEYNMVPYDLPAMTSEKEYLDFVHKVLEKIDLDSYDYKCETRYASTSDRGIRVTTVDGFRIMEENETVREYSFYYTKTVDGVQLPGSVAAEFDVTDDSPSLVTFEMYEAEQENSAYKSVIDKMSEIEEKADEYMHQQLKENYTMKDIKHNEKYIFVREGKVYVKIVSEITYQSNADDSIPYTSFVTTITG